jgi:NADH:ubiquinone oxidoreductase subunit 5 (subunit L)/multisubunit Na+/H+ antiporter MnhA subunit
MDTQEIIRNQHPQPAQWIERLARFGYAAKGIVYALVGILAFQAAFNWGGKVTGTKGVFRTIASQPFGKVMLFLVGVGLLGYVVWRFVQAFTDPEHRDEGAKAFARRVSYFISGLIYGSLALFALRIVFSGSGSSSSSSSSSERTASLLAQPFGQWLVGLVGVAVVAYGFYCFYRAITTKFRRKLKLAEMSPKEEKWSTRIARFGLTAKGGVSVIIGYFFIQAARTSDASEARTTEGALQTIQQQPYGGWLMGIVALGLIAYGIHLGVQARYRRISP